MLVCLNCQKAGAPGSVNLPRAHAKMKPPAAAEAASGGRCKEVYHSLMAVEYRMCRPVCYGVKPYRYTTCLSQI